MPSHKELDSPVGPRGRATTGFAASPPKTSATDATKAAEAKNFVSGPTPSKHFGDPVEHRHWGINE